MAVPAPPNNTAADTQRLLSTVGRRHEGDCDPLRWCPPWCALLQSLCPLCKGNRGSVDTGKLYIPVQADWKSKNHRCCRPSTHPVVYACPMDWVPIISGGGTSCGLVSHKGTAGCMLQDSCVTHTKAHWVPWEMHLKTSHQTETLMRMCAEKGLGWTKVRHTVS